MPLQAVETKRLYRQIADQLRKGIAGGEFALGARLPPERQPMHAAPGEWAARLRQP